MDAQSLLLLEKRRLRSEYIRTGALLGFFGGLIMAVITTLLFSTVGMEMSYPAKLVAGTFFGVQAMIMGWEAVVMGTIAHFVVAILFGMVFGLFLSLDTKIPFIWSIAYSITVWSLMTFAILPVLNPTMEARIQFVSIWWFAEHLIYGSVLSTLPVLGKQSIPVEDVNIEPTYTQVA